MPERKVAQEGITERNSRRKLALAAIRGDKTLSELRREGYEAGRKHIALHRP